MFDTFRNRLVVEGWLVARTALRIGTGRAAEPVGTDLPVIRDALGRPFIPGSSFKGALRAHVESVIRAVVPGGRFGACLPTSEQERCVRRGSCRARRDKPYADRDPVGIGDLQAWADAEEKKAKEAARKAGDPAHRIADDFLAEAVWSHSCLACRTFGSPWLASHVQVRDLPVDEALWFGQYQVRNGVAIDRDTETVSGALLYDYEVVPADTRFECQIVAENLEAWQSGLLWLGLQAFVAGTAALGGFRSRGLGQVQFDDGEPRLYHYALDADDPVGSLVEYLTGKDRRGKLLATADVEGLGWLEALKAELALARQRSA